MERPILHRYKEIEEFPSTLNNSQMWNWHTRMFLTEEKAALAEHEEKGTTGRYTREELADLEKTLKEHEKWLNEWVEKQKSVKMYEDPVIETKEMKERAKVLEMALQKLVRKPKPKPKPVKKSSSSSSANGETTSTATTSAGAESTPGHDEL
jgi:hypoxia up-regulated 1